MKAFVFPGQGAQFVGMGKDLYDNNAVAKELFEKANEILGFRITDLMFEGTEEDLRQTKVTQPAIFLHSVILAKTLGDEFKPEMVAGHSLGEFSALVAAGALSFEDGLRLVSTRALAMQKACEAQPSTMAAVLGLTNEQVEEICASIDAVVAPANYNCPGQVVISGVEEGIDAACEKALAAGARRALKLKVGGAFHARSRHQQGSVLYTNLPCLSECRRNASHRPRGNQEKPHCAADRSSALDTDSTKNDCRRRRRLYRARPGRSASRLDPQD